MCQTTKTFGELHYKYETIWYNNNFNILCSQNWGWPFSFTTTAVVGGMGSRNPWNTASLSWKTFLLWASMSQVEQRYSMSSGTQSRHLITASTAQHLWQFWTNTLSAESFASKSIGLAVFILTSVRSCLCSQAETILSVPSGTWSAVMVSLNSWSLVSKKQKYTFTCP